MALDDDPLAAQDDLPLVFSEYRHVVGDFSEQMHSLISEIRTVVQNDEIAKEVIRPTEQVPGWFEFEDPYYPNSPVPGFDLERFRNDVNVLADRLSWFVEDAQPELLDNACESLGEAIEHLYAANGGGGEVSGGAGGLQLAYDQLQPRWDSDTMVLFTHKVYAPFGEVVGGQAKLARELERAARSFQEIIGRTRLDSLSLGSQLAGKLHAQVPGIAETAIAATEDALTVYGGVKTAAKLPTNADEAADYVLSLAGLALDGFEQNVDDTSANGMGVIAGERAKDFIPSAEACIGAAWDGMFAQHGIVQEALNADLQEIDETKGKSIELSEETGSAVDFGPPNKGLRVDDIALIRLAGHSYLPAVAASLHQAHVYVTSARTWVEAAVKGTVAGYGGYSWGLFYGAVDRLDAAITRTRDLMYQTGQALVDIADDYYDTEDESRQEMLRAFREYNASYEESIYMGEPSNISDEELWREKEELRKRSS